MGNINIWWALGFMVTGFAIAHVFNAMAWRKYYEGRDERMLREVPHTDQFQRLRLHLEQRREVLRNEISKGEVEAECIGLRSTESITQTNTGVKD